MAYATSQSMEQPPFLGFVATTGDALLLFQAARTSVIPRVVRRLTDAERHNMIKSGSVFIWNEEECRIKRWTDSMTWSPSRIMGNFLVYRESTERGTGRSPAGRAAMRARDPNRSSGVSRQRAQAPSLSPEELALRRSLLGSLADDSGPYKPRGLIKKTMSLVIDGISHHLISYYKLDDVLANKLATPSSLPHISAVGIPPDLLDRRIGFNQPPRVELVNGVITYAGESADATPLQPMESSAPRSEAEHSIGKTVAETSQNQLASQLSFFDVFAGANDSPYDILTMPALKIPEFGLSGEPSFVLESSPTCRNPSRRLSIASHRHEPYPSSSVRRSRCKLSVSPESSTSSCSQSEGSDSSSSIRASQPTSFNSSADDLHMYRLGQSISCGPYFAPAPVPGYSQLVANSFPENFPSFNLATGPQDYSDSPDATYRYDYQYTHPHSPPPTPGPEISSPSNRPSLTVDTRLDHRFAYSCPPSTVSHSDALVTPPPTACTDSLLTSTQFVSNPFMPCPAIELPESAI